MYATFDNAGTDQRIVPPSIDFVPRSAARMPKLPGVTVRANSRQDYRGLPAASAQALATQEFAALRRRGAGAPELSPGTHIVGYAGDHVLRVRNGRMRGLVLSSLPVRRKRGRREVPVDISLARHGRRWRAKSPLVPTSFGDRIRDGFSISDLVTAIPATASDRTGAEGRPLGRDRLFFPSIRSDTDFIAESTALGFEAYWQLRSPSSPALQSLAHRLAPGVALRQRGQTIDILRRGRRVGRILPPSATDAAGRPVRVSQRLRGQELEVAVDHRRGDVTYPVLVDPGYVSDNWLSNPTWRQGNPNGLAAWTASSNHELIYSGLTCDLIAQPDCDDNNVFGLFLRAKPAWYQNGNRGLWQYKVQGQGPPHAWIQRMTVSWLRSSTNGGPATFIPSIFISNPGAAIAQVNLPANYGPTGQITVSDPNAPTTSDVPRGNFAGTQLWMSGDGNRTTWNTLSVGGAYLEMYEASYPALDSKRLDWSESAWQTGTAPATGEFQMANLGFGIRQNTWRTYRPGQFPSGPSELSINTPNATCDGQYLTRCSTYFKTPFEVPTIQMPDGVNNLHLGGTSPSGQGSDGNANAFDYKVDRSPPRRLQLSGSLWANRNQVVPSGSYSLTAVAEDWGSTSSGADASCSDTSARARRSGVRRIILEINGTEEARSPDQPSETCSLSWTGPSFNTNDREPGQYAIRVTVTDGVGLARTEVFTATVADRPINTVPPTVSGVLKEGERLNVSDGTWAGVEPMTTTYQWQRCAASGAPCADIRGATRSTYVPFFADIGSPLRVVVRKENAFGGGEKASTTSAVIRSAYLDLPREPDPEEESNTSDATLSPGCTPDDVTYRGSANCEPDANAADVSRQRGLTQRSYGVSDHWRTPDNYGGAIGADGQPSGGLFGGPYLIFDSCDAEGRFALTAEQNRNESDPRFRQFRPNENSGLQKVRLIVPYDVMRGMKKADGTPNCTPLDTNTDDPYRIAYYRVAEWIEAASANGMTVMVSFNRSVVEEDGVQLVAPPDVGTYTMAVEAFVDEFWFAVRDFTAWNEPNHSDQPTSIERSVKLFGAGREMDGARLAARYFNALREICSVRCFVAAGDFAESSFPVAARPKPPAGRYFATYEKYLTTNPSIWAYHAYSSIADRNAGRLMNFLAWTKDLQFGGCVISETDGCRPRVWLTEQGGLVYREQSDTAGTTAPNTQKCNDAGYEAQVQEASEDVNQFFTTVLPSIDASERARITRFYYYDWSGTPSFDAGLLYAKQHGTKTPVSPCPKAGQDRPALTTYRDRVLSAPLP